MRGSVLALLLNALLLSAGLASGQQPPSRLGFPGEAEQAEARKIAREIYGPQHAKAKTVEEKKALAERILQTAHESKADPASQVVLLQLARDVAALAGEIEPAMRAVSHLTETYDVDGFGLQVETVLKTASSASVPGQHAKVADRAQRLRETAFDNDDFEAAEKLGDAALAAARKADDAALVKKIHARNQEVEAVRTAYAQVSAALKRLAEPEHVTDATANLVCGRYFCFHKGQWEKGLPMLALGNDPQLRDPAIKELTPPSAPDEQKRLADRWWELAQQMDENVRPRVEQRARLWYQRALPGLTGLTKDAVEKRLTKCSADNAERAEEKPTLGALSGRVIQHNRRVAEWVLASGGSVAIRLQGQPIETTIGAAADLPKGVFVVTSVYLFDKKGVSDRSLSALSGLHHLRKLNLAGTKVTDAGMMHLAGLTSLEELYLGGTAVGDNGMRFVGNLTNLTFLGLFYTRVTDNGVRHLTRLQKLQRVNAGGTKISDAALRSALPNCTIERPR